MYRHPLDHRRIQRPMLILLLRQRFRRISLDRKSLHLIQYVPTVQHFPQNGINIIQMRLSLICYEKLRLVAIAPRVGHAHLTPLIMRIVRMEFVLECPSPYRFSAFSRSGRIATLDHEAFHVAMKGGAVVVAAGAECEEIEGGSRCSVAEDFDFDIAEAGMESDGHFLTEYNVIDSLHWKYINQRILPDQKISLTMALLDRRRLRQWWKAAEEGTNL
mmetsp:Transcript_17926/g.34180  ORF Transcript_17926/g.34180 Transcript_17926/m.34180 type:complete len:217 (+) Transcript_17926:160-810(+)